MSEFGKDPIRDFSIFNSMSTEALEEILRLDSQMLNDEESDIDAILYITEVIARREKEHPTGRFTDVQSAWESYKTNYLPYAGGESLYEDVITDTASVHEKRPMPEATANLFKRKNRSIRKTVLIAAIIAALILGGTMTAYAVGFDFWGAVAKWTRDTFGFATTEPIESAASYRSLQDALSDYEIKEPLAPNWIPDGYELSSVSVSQTPVRTTLLATYISNGDELLINITSLTDVNNNSNIFEKDGDNVTLFEAGGIKHYIMSNEARINAVWLNNSYECSIIGNITEADVIKMIDSIYER